MPTKSAVCRLLEDDVVPVMASTPAWRKSKKRGERRIKRSKSVTEGFFDDYSAQQHVRSKDMRFDCEARVEIWVDQDDLEFDSVVEKIVKGTLPVEEKKKLVLERAREIAAERLNDVKGVSIEADISVSNINVDRIDWGGLLEPEPEDAEEEDSVLPGGPLPDDNNPA